ncbi:hypothetical protein POTOM_008599 [Populus tomentosa]|uniref:Uncharacterized protein n=1 Tax=Populus tomentosa TaxID=118781 RepID=A0A8X8AME8_POPTO|nr:hypothetical protein POTOM_008599 [Populus tomentosa]
MRGSAAVVDLNRKEEMPMLFADVAGVHVVKSFWSKLMSLDFTVVVEEQSVETPAVARTRRGHVAATGRLCFATGTDKAKLLFVVTRTCKSWK